MLSPADAALVARDPDLPGLAVLLDPDRLGDLLGAPVRRRYLRYKPGTSCVAAVRLGDRDVAVTVVSEPALPKLDKTARKAPPGSVLLVRRELGMLATTAAADRDLPALADLAATVRRLGLPPGEVRQLSWKPARRWVGRLGDDVVLRAYRPGELPALPALPGTAAALAGDRRLAVRALRWTPGVPLDVLLRDGAADDPPVLALRSAGTALARLHDRPAGALPAAPPGLEAAAAHLAVLLPDLAADAAALAAVVSARVDAGMAVPGGGGATLHGDFSADQVVVDGAAVRLVDLDRVRAGAPADDLGSWRAACLVAGLPAAAEQALCEGYADVRPLPPAAEVERHTAAHLLRRAAEPFRTGAPDWESRVRALVRAASDTGVLA